MATYYVAATGGDNSNDGSSGNPWATLAYAVTAVSSGDTIYMQAGTHTINTAVNIPEGVHLIGAGETSIITSTSITGERNHIISLQSASLSNGNQSISYLKFDGNELTAALALYITKRHNVKIHHCTFIDFKYEAVMWSGDGTGNVGTDPPGYDEDNPPDVYVTGSEFHDNIMTGTSVYDSYGHGALWIGGHEGMLIYNNTIDCSTRLSGTGGYCIKTQFPGFLRGLKLYNNTLIVGDNTWKFAIEGFAWYGCEIYNNTIIGAIDINIANKGVAPAYEYGLWIHDNILGPETSVAGYSGTILEWSTSDIIIERNLFRNCRAYAMEWTPRTGNVVENYQIRYNVIQNNTSRGFEFCTSSTTAYFNNFHIYNNVIHTSAIWGFEMFGICDGLYIRNNIITGASYYWLGFRNTSTAPNNVYIQNNILYNNATSNAVLFEGGEPETYVNSGNLTSNPLFTISGSDFTLQAGSPAIDAGLDVSLYTDFRSYVVPINGIPDIGAYEYGSSPINTYYVAATGGDNSNDGTSESPWATLAYAVTAVSSGDTIYMQAGTHTINTRINVPVGINITGAGETSIIKSTVSTEYYVALYLHSTTQGTNGNQSISYINMDGSALTGWGAIQIDCRSNVKIHHCTFSDFYSTAVIFNAAAAYIGSEPSIFATGNEFYSNQVDNCSDYPASVDNGQGAVMFGGQDGMKIYDNEINQTTRDPIRRNGYCIKFYSSGYNKGFEIYNNTLNRAITTQSYPYYDFSIETWHTLGGAHIYNNTMTGGIDFAGGSYTCLIKGDYDYGAWVHDNTIGPASYMGSETTGIYLERNSEWAIIERNTIKNFHNGIMFSPGSGETTNNHDIRYNVFTGIRYYGIRFILGTTGAYADSINFYNNVFEADPTSSLVGIGLITVGTTTNINVINNIIVGFDYAPILGWSNGSQTLDNLKIQNNIFYQNANSNAPLFTDITPSNYTNSGNAIDNPDFVGGSPYSYQLAESSPAIDAGLDVSLYTDFRSYVVPINGIPDIGAYEYGSYSDASTFVPTVTTTAISDISTYTATSGGNVTYDGSVALVYRGICWSTSASPTTADTSTRDSSTGEGSYVSYLTSLNASTHYHVRAFAYNSVGTSYGTDVSFNTLAAPDVSTLVTSHSYAFVSNNNIALLLNNKLIIKNI